MSVKYIKSSRTFKLDTPNTTYMIGLADEPGYIGQVYYGKRVNDEDLNYLMRTNEAPFIPSKNAREKCSFLDTYPFEMPCAWGGDYRDPAFEIRTASGHSTCELVYESHDIIKGKKKLSGLPATFADESEAETLEIKCVEPDLGFHVILSYTAFSDVDIITKSVRVINDSADTFYLERIISAVLNIEDTPAYDMITMHGSWARERHICRREIPYGRSSSSSTRGESGHQDHPFLAVLEHTATEDSGNVYGMSFVYSGNFLAQCERNQFDTIRAMMGINPYGFCFKLLPGDEFTAPEVVMTFSSKGLGQMSRNFHDVYRKHLIRGEYKDKKRPILINNWEATYFDFNTEKLLDIARCAAVCGIEMLVMDDGWFGKRSSDNCALGDWFVNEEKLPGGLKYLVDEVNKLGLKFGIWVEPEMISPDSDLYRAHPDWAIKVPYKTPAMSREQYVLDFSRKEIRDCIYERISAILKSANIEYVKWDMNRQLADIGSICLDFDRQGELFHRYCLGVYEMQERLINDFPHILLENCSGGGARFDAGMLYYSPQIWCSDDTDAIERLTIQEGTSLCYPVSCMGAHVSVCPNHSVGRNTPFETRGYVALAGTFGYELDITKLSDEEREMIKGQIADYHRYNDLIREGDLYRCESYRENHNFNLTGVVSKDKKEALFTFVRVMGVPNSHSRRIYFRGLDENMMYKVEGSEYYLSGAALMYAGFNVTGLWGDFNSRLIHLIGE
ncbi:MAG: alpha-galactosidase [Lachnospiraceae bacterium]|nr:alpha-galactosidase [Lachnospiraceae bacterium]